MSRRKWAIILAVVLLVASGAVLAQYLTHNAAPMSITVPDDYTTIQSAIGNCTPGSTIYVRNGIYNELLTIDKPLTLTGENNQNTIIKGYTEKYMSFNTVIIQADNVVVSNFNITGSDHGVGILANSSNCQITKCNIKAFDTGIRVNGKNHIVTENNIVGGLTWGIVCHGSNMSISRNVIENFRSGILIEASNVKIEKNAITNGKIYVDDYSAGGIILSLGEQYYISENIIQKQITGILYKGANRSLVNNNTITQNQAGAILSNYLFINSTSSGKDNIFVSNNMVDNQVQVIIETEMHRISTLPNGTDLVSWDNGVVGNYWGDYQSRYPNATQNNNTGTYNIPYAIDANNKDNHPLIHAISY
jgi:hypothetical protein